MKVKYYSHTIIDAQGDEIDPGSKIVVSVTSPAYLKTLCIAVEYADAWGFNSFSTLSLATKGESIVVSNPWKDPNEIEEALYKHSDEYLDEQQSYITKSLIAPYGVGIHSDNIQKFPITLSDLDCTKNKNQGLNDLISLKSMFFNEPKISRSGKMITAKHRKLFSRNYTEEINIPVFVEKSFESFKSSVGAWFLEETFTHKKVEIENNGYNSDGTRKWYARLNPDLNNMDLASHNSIERLANNVR